MPTGHITTLVGNNAATVLTSAIQSIRSSERGAPAGTVSIVMLLIGAASFVSGKTTIAYYLGRNRVESAYGAAGSLLVLLAWVYHSSQTEHACAGGLREKVTVV